MSLIHTLPANICLKGGKYLKQLIVLISSIMLGIIIFSLIAGPNEGSVYSAVKSVWQTELSIKTLQGADE